jgi:UDP-N-acetylglucosamine 2-epimerase (non-hydrolysing)
MIKVMTIVGTRPEVIKLCRVIDELDRHVDHVLVHTGQNHDYELNQIFFDELEIRKPDYFLEAAAETLAQSIGSIIVRSDDVMEKEQPDAILLLGDTNSCLSVISAKRRKIPVFHMEAGNRCFDQRVPEEINRKLVDHLSDINMPYTEHARRYLIAEGIKPETIIKTGSPMKEIIDYYMPRIMESKIHSKLNLSKGEYFVLSSHREENVDSAENFSDLIDSINAIASKYGKPIIISTHPRTMKRFEQSSNAEYNKLASFLKPLGFFDYVRLQMDAACVISDSGTITEESSILNFPAVTIRQVHERPEGMDVGTLIMCGLKSERVISSIDTVMSQYSREMRQFRVAQDYEEDNISKKVVRIILSYIDYVNRTIWYKDR